MPAYPLRALVLRRTKLGETDLILTLLAADGRQVRAVAKGARKPRSRFGARTEPFSVLDLLVATGRSLDVVTEAEIVTSHDAIRADYDRSLAAAVVADVLDKLSVEGQAEPRSFEMALVTLDVIEVAPSSTLERLVLAFLLKAMAMHGYRPSLRSCACCGSPAVHPVRFSIDEGGVLCPACWEGRSAAPLSPAACEAISMLLTSRMAEVPVHEIEAAVVTEVRRLVRAYVGFHLPARLRALDYFWSAVGAGEHR